LPPFISNSQSTSYDCLSTPLKDPEKVLGGFFGGSQKFQPKNTLA